MNSIKAKLGKITTAAIISVALGALLFVATMAYHATVFFILWNWFMPALNAPQLTFGAALGVWVALRFISLSFAVTSANRLKIWLSPLLYLGIGALVKLVI